MLNIEQNKKIKKTIGLKHGLPEIRSCKKKR